MLIGQVRAYIALHLKCLTLGIAGPYAGLMPDLVPQSKIGLASGYVTFHFVKL